MGFRESLADYTDSTTGLVGVMPNTAGWSSGNPLVETGVACLLLKKLGQLSSFDPANKAVAFFSCLPKSGFFTKLPGVANSKASHDDVIGIVTGFAVLGPYCDEFLREDVIEYGNKHWWVLSTTGEFYWDALTKPWHYAFYTLAAGKQPNFIAKGSLVAFIAYDAIFNENDSSDKKLCWMMLESIKGKSWVVDQIRKFWWWRLRKTWGSMSNVFARYFGANHIFTIYCRE